MTLRFMQAALVRNCQRYYYWNIVPVKLAMTNLKYVHFQDTPKEILLSTFHTECWRWGSPETGCLRYSTRTKGFVWCPFYTKSSRLRRHPPGPGFYENPQKFGCVWYDIRKSVDNIMKVTKLLNITKGWRNDCLSTRVERNWLSCTFLYGASYKNLGHFHTGWCNHKQWKQLWFLVLLLLEIWIDCGSLAGGKVWSVYMHTVLGIGLKMSNLTLNPVLDESFCPRTLHPNLSSVSR